MIWLYAILGIIQGILEWLPISSEGMVALASNWMVSGNPVDTALFLHLGTMLAVLFYFKKDWKEIILLRDRKLVKFLIIATVISLGIGFPIYKVIRNVAVGNTLLLITGLGLLITAYFHKKDLTLNLKDHKLAGIAGLLQGLAIIPGFSRSGSTIFGLSLGDKEPAEILRLSYLMSVPVVLASNLYLLLQDPVLAWKPGVVALLSSFVTGILSLSLLLKLVERINFFKFALAFSIICLVGATFGFLL
ncbi:MAG: undecaprenyl-diphosphate phosphatase [Candidatus Paceibacterota bacterium]